MGESFAKAALDIVLPLDECGLTLGSELGTSLLFFPKADHRALCHREKEGPGEAGLHVFDVCDAFLVLEGNPDSLFGFGFESRSLKEKMAIKPANRFDRAEERQVFVFRKVMNPGFLYVGKEVGAQAVAVDGFQIPFFPFRRDGFGLFEEASGFLKPIPSWFEGLFFPDAVGSPVVHDRWPQNIREVKIPIFGRKKIGVVHGDLWLVWKKGPREWREV